MSDDNGKGRIVGIDHIPKSRKDRMSRPPTTDEVQKWIAAGSIAAMRNVYEQMAEENVKLFQQLEEICTERVLAEIERRSWRGKVKALWLRLRKQEVVLMPPPEALTLTPKEGA